MSICAFPYSFTFREASMEYRHNRRAFYHFHKSTERGSTMRKFRKVLTNVLLSACGMAFAVPGHAGYKLSDEVKNPTPALLEASEIGVRVFNNKAMQDLPDKDALVVMSFGTTMKETRDKTINATVAEIQKALPDVKVVVAYTSHIIIDRIRAK